MILNTEGCQRTCHPKQIYWCGSAKLALPRQWHATYSSHETVISLLSVQDCTSLISGGLMGQNVLQGLLGRPLYLFFILYLFYFTHTMTPSCKHAYHNNRQLICIRAPFHIQTSCHYQTRSPQTFSRFEPQCYNISTTITTPS